MTETRPNYSIYPTPEPQSDLDAALAKLREDSSKTVHLERRHVLALLVELERLYAVEFSLPDPFWGKDDWYELEHG